MTERRTDGDAGALRPDAVAWLVRGGRKATHIDALVRRGVAAVSWASVLGTVDLRTVDDEAIVAMAALKNRGSPKEDLRELREFQTAIREGDAVVMPDTPRGDVVMGAMAGPYDYSTIPVAGDLRHVRRVAWFGRYRRDDLPEGARHRMDVHQRTVGRLSDQADWLAVARDIAGGRGHPVHRTQVARASRTPAATPRPHRVCPSCGLARAEAMFTSAAGICRDCD